MKTSPARWMACLTLAALPALALPVAAQPAGPSFAEAVEAAWARSVGGQAAEARRASQAARRDAAASWTPEPPSVRLSHETDQTDRNRGLRETEAEIDIPLWLPGTRAAVAAVTEAEGRALEAALAQSRLALAGDVREAAWGLRLAANDRDGAQRQMAAAQDLADDVARRVKAGDLARTDANQAEALVHEATARHADAEARLLRAQRLYRALTGLTEPPAADETPVPAADIDAHPRIGELTHAAELARARLRHAAKDTRDPPELSLGVVRERGDFDERYATTTRVGVRIPFGTDARNRPRIGAAGAELAEAEAALAVERERLLAELDAAQADLGQARRIETASETRARLAADTRQLLDKAFRLGEIDLPARLRAENEAYDAERALTRARLETGRARSRLHQAYGLLP